jgi:hypothetical protein
MTDKQSEAYVVPLYERLEKIPADIRFGVKDGDDWRAGTVWYPIGAMCQQAAAELRRLHEVNAELVEALQAVIRGVPDTWEGVVRAQEALRKAQGENNE